jgi:hypothetical protein
VLDKGVCAEVRVGREHLRLFSEQNALGVQASVYNVNAKKWIAPSESVETIEQGKLKAATYAETYLRQVANLELPPLQWKESRAASEERPSGSDPTGLPQTLARSFAQ